MAEEKAVPSPATPVRAGGDRAPIETRILTIRGRSVILDTDLALLYGTTTKRLNQQVRRNRTRFPPDFLFRVSREERAEVVTFCDHLRNLKYSRRLPLAFTEHGAIMAASVLNSPQAVRMSIFVVRAFVRLRGFLVAHGELAAKVAELERQVGSHDETLRAIVRAIRGLLEPPRRPGEGKIGFNVP